MFKWLGKLKVWRNEPGCEHGFVVRDAQDDYRFLCRECEERFVVHPGLLRYTVHEYGQYSYKPVIARAISAVVGVSQAEVCNWVADPEVEIYLNEDLLQGANWARVRLESGDYEIKIPSQAKVWRFFIA